MIVNIENSAEHTLVSFKASDFTCFDDIQRIASAIAAGGYCFEAGALLSDEFIQFIDGIKPRNSYGIMLGVDEQNQPFVKWGRIKRQRVKHD